MKKKQLFSSEPSTEFLERRKSDRIIIIAPVELTVLESSDESICKTGDISRGHTLNISAGGLLQEDGMEEYGPGGLLTEVDKEIPVGSRIKVDMTIPLPGYTSSFNLEGVTLRVNVSPNDSDKYEVALKFTRLLAHDFNNVKLEAIQKMLGI
jgi:hypothetical protein